MTVELSMSKLQQATYLALHGSLAGYLTRGQDEDTKEGLINMTVHRALCHAVADGRLSTLEKRVSARRGLNVILLND